MMHVAWLVSWFLLLETVLCNHFRGGTSSWKYNAKLNEIEIIRRTFWTSTVVRRCVGDDFGGSPFIQLDCDEICTIRQDNYYCKDSSKALDLTTGERKMSYTVSSRLLGWFSGCCWPDSSSWDLKIYVDVMNKAAGEVNTSPVSLMLPVIRIQHGCGQGTINIPVDDADGEDTVKCRWALESNQECGEVCQRLSDDNLNSQCTLNVNSVEPGTYIVALQIEDFRHVDSSNIPYSSIPLQFAIEVYSSPQQCAELPHVFTSLSDGSQVTIKPNSMWTQTIVATSTNGFRISEIITASPAGLQMSNLTQIGNSLQWYINVSWTPDNTQIGPNIFCYAAVDNLRRMSTQQSLVLFVSEANLQINCSSNDGRGPCGQMCNQLRRSVYCTCKPGFTLLEDRLHCLGVPRDLVLTATKSAINASWNSPLFDENGSEKFTYTLTCDSSSVSMQKPNGGDTSVILANLIPFTNYSCCVTAYTSTNAQSQVCDSVQTMEAAPTDPPRNLYLTPFGSIAMTISWYPPLQPNGRIIGSNIYANFSNGTMKIIKLTGGNYRRYLLQNMQPEQEVQIQISSSTNGGEGPRSDIHLGRTDCSKGTYYSSSTKKCTSHCRCGEGQVQYYYDSISQSQYAACVPVGDYQVGISSISLNNSINTNSTAGTLAATVLITYSLPLTTSINVRMTSHLYTPYYNFDVWKYWWIPSSLDIKNQSSNQILYPTWNGWWYGSNNINWREISSNSMMCNNSNGKQYAITPVNIYLSSSLHYEGELRIDLQFTQSNYYYYYWYYYWYWYYYGFVSGLSVQVKPNYNCPPLLHYDMTTQQCVNICACGLAAPKDSAFCATLSPYWNFATFARHTITYQVPYSRPIIPNISTRLYYTLEDWISRYFLDYYFYHNANNTNNVHILLKLDVQYEYSNYTTKAAYGTDIPDVVLTLVDGTIIKAGDPAASIVLDEVLSPLTKSCNRSSDGVKLQFLPFVVSVSFGKPISSLGMHNFTINARLASTNWVIDSWLQYYTDAISLSITVGPGTNGSKPSSTSCGIIRNRYLQTFDLTVYDNVKILPSQLYSVSDRITIDNPGFPFGNSLQSEVYISSDGLISFGKPVVYSYPAKFPSNYAGIRNAYLVAPFWIFNDIRTAGSVSYVTINDNDNDALQLVSKYISSYYNTSFSAKWMLAVQWKGIHPYPHGGADWWWGSYYGDTFHAIINKENNYQAILTTNGISSYAVFTYECGKMGWSGYWDGWRAIIGYNANGEYYKNHPASGYDNLAEAVSCQNKICNVLSSSLVYNLSLPSSDVDKIRSDCINLYDEDVALHGDNASIASIAAQLEPCPCTFWQAWFDFGRFRWQFSEYLCFIQRSPANLTTAVQQCCYSSWSTGGIFGALVKTGIDKGSMLLYHPRRNPDLYQKYDVDFKDKCCGVAKMCKLYNQRRPSDDCAAYQQPVMTWGWGDPHITTLDGRTYTFNGWGEYIMLQHQSSSSQDSFTLQGRMVPFNMTSATQYSAFAFGNHHYTIEIGIVGMSEFSAYVDGKSISSELKLINSTYTNSDETIIITREADNSVSCVTPNGVSITINNTNGALSIVVIVPPSWKGQTKGLLGNFNGNQSDEFVPRGKTEPLSGRISDRNLHWKFGQTWNVSHIESLFTYRGDKNESWQFYAHPNHIPIFADEIVGTETGFAICGNDTQCLYDFSQTNSTIFAMETVRFSQTNKLIVKRINNFPPVINGSNSYKVTLEQQSIYNFTVVDIDDNITVGVVEGIPYNATLAGSNGMYTFNWTISNLTNASLTFFAMDSLNATSVLSVQVQICACTNGGNCTLNGLLNDDDQSVVMKCVCPKAYDGAFCEKDRNGCLEASCFTGVQCYDVPAPGVGIMCGSCPSGYIGDGYNCIDNDECNTNSSICQQVCTNTPGSFICSCQDGYTMISNEVCTDINECMGVNDCQQTCINTAGSYYCDCTDGFQLDSDSHRCTVTSACSPGHNCSDTCALLNNTNTCFCSPGFALGADKKTCNDINECNLSPCEQTCRNTIGSFRCSCAAGFQLNADRRSCDDIDECIDAALSGSELCPGSFECLNSIGSYLCVCQPGYQNRSGICQVNIPPRITGAVSVLLAKIGETLVYNFSVVDDGDTYSVGVLDGIPAGGKLTYNKGNYTFTWKVQQVQNVSLTFYVVDSLNTTTQLRVQVLTCGCQNEGNCTLNALKDTSEIVTCECSKAYSGAFCEKDRNGCLEASCYTGVQCYDVPAPGVGIMCGSCPSGYIGDGQNCADINECLLQTSVCSQLCHNTVGSYTCSCNTGFTLDSDKHTCTDVNECILRTSACTQLCNNTIGSYTCSCNTGYKLDANNHTCSDINECALGTSGCTQLCNNTVGSYTCSCNAGYKLATNYQTCSDINECLSGTAACTQLCYNTDGSYKCSCNNGFILAADQSACNDRNECLLGTSGCTQLCNNTVGSYICYCNTGYILSADNRTCSDINECVFGTSACTQLCYNTPGSYMCSCNPGYVLAADYRTCNAITTVNDTVTGEPFFTVPLWLNISNPLNGPALCYEVEGKANKTFNLLSDVCTSVNAYYSPGKNVGGSNVITQIGILAKGISNQCRRILLNANGCTVAVNGTVVSTYQQDGIAVAKVGDRVRVTMPNCGSPNLIAWIVCEEAQNVKKLHFIISRGVNLRPTSHGIIGQFWNIPITVVPYNGRPPNAYSVDSLKIITVYPVKSKSRSFIGVEHKQTWDYVNKACYYSGDTQGSITRIAKPDDPVIEGTYADYTTSDLFSYNFRFNQFGGCSN